jgi:ketosteroid isomerase-like protein
MAEAAEQTRLEENKEVAVSFFRFLREKQVERAVALLDPEGTNRQMLHARFWPSMGWQVPPGSGPYPTVPLEFFRAELRALGKAFDCKTFGFVVDDVVAEGDRVVVALHNDGVYPDGQRYDMAYCFILTIRDGKIVECVEFADTHYGLANRDVGSLNQELLATDPDATKPVQEVLAATRAEGA